MAGFGGTDSKTGVIYEVNLVDPGNRIGGYFDGRDYGLFTYDGEHPVFAGTGVDLDFSKSATISVGGLTPAPAAVEISYSCDRRRTMQVPTSERVLSRYRRRSRPAAWLRTFSRQLGSDCSCS